MKKIILILLTIATLSGCVSNELKEERTKLTWYVNFSWYQNDFNDSLVSKAIEDKFNVDLEIISPSGDSNRKLATMVNQDELADIMTLEWWNPQINTMINDNMLYSLNDLAAEYDINFVDNIDQLVFDFNAIDNELYYYPNSYFLPEDYQNNNYLGSNQCFMVRKDIYEALGEPDMTTIDGYYNAIVKASKLYPDVSMIGAHEFNENGNVSFDEYLMNFLSVPYLKSGKYYDRFTDPDYLAWLEMYNQLYREGYIDDSIFTDKREQMDEKLTEGGYFSMIYQRTDIEYPEIALSANNPEMIYIAVDGPKNSNGDNPVLPGIGINGWCDTMISKKSENPELAMQIINYLLSEDGQKLLYLGIENETYTVGLNQEVTVNQELEDLYNTNRIKFNEEYGFKDTYWMLEKTRINLKWQQELQVPLNQLEAWSYPYTVYPVNDTREMDNDYLDIKMRIDSLWSQTIIDLITSDSLENFDLRLNKFVKDRASLNFDYYQEVKASEIQANLENLVKINEEN